MNKKVMVVFGTRPETIKMCPLVKELRTRERLDTVVCVTGQHREMLDQVLEAFNVFPDFDLSIMKDKQILFDIYDNFKLLLNDTRIYNTMAQATNPYGDGFACKRITNILLTENS